MAKLKSECIKFKKGADLYFSFNSINNVRLVASFEPLGVTKELLRLEIDADFAAKMFPKYIKKKDLEKIVIGILQGREGMELIEEIVLEKIRTDEDRWTIFIEPFVVYHPNLPDRSELEYKVRFRAPFGEYDLEEICMEDSDILISAGDIDQLIDSIDQNKLRKLFNAKFWDNIAEHPIDDNDE